MSHTDLSAQLETQVDTLFCRAETDGVSLALVIQQDGQVIVERYGTQPENVFQPTIEITAESTLTSWSMAKSIAQAPVGALLYAHETEGTYCNMANSSSSSLSRPPEQAARVRPALVVLASRCSRRDLSDRTVCGLVAT
jgi:hypothetical protein